MDYFGTPPSIYEWIISGYHHPYMNGWFKGSHHTSWNNWFGDATISTSLFHFVPSRLELQISRQIAHHYSTLLFFPGSISLIIIERATICATPLIYSHPCQDLLHILLKITLLGSEWCRGFHTEKGFMICRAHHETLQAFVLKDRYCM